MKLHFGVCPKCFKQVNQKLTRHHIAPRRFFKNSHAVLLLCRDCHSDVDDLFPQQRKLTYKEYFDITLLWLQGKQPKVL